MNVLRNRDVELHFLVTVATFDKGNFRSCECFKELRCRLAFRCDCCNFSQEEQEDEAAADDVPEEPGPERDPRGSTAEVKVVFQGPLWASHHPR